jgi:hypothetical protein
MSQAPLVELKRACSLCIKLPQQPLRMEYRDAATQGKLCRAAVARQVPRVAGGSSGIDHCGRCHRPSRTLAPRAIHPRQRQRLAGDSKVGKVYKLYEFDKSDELFDNFRATEPDSKLRRKPRLLGLWVAVVAFFQDNWKMLKRAPGHTETKEW